VVDRIEIPFGINGTNIQTAADVVDRITENGDGWAVIDLGNNNSVTLHGIRSADVNNLIFQVQPITTNTVQGTSDADVLIGTDGNDRIEGSTDPFGRFEDGYDILVGGKGDDVLIGGPANSSVGGCIADIYRFGDDSGNDVNLGFTLSLSGYSGCDVVDRIEIKENINNSGIYTATDLINNSSNNSAGYAVLNLGSGNTVTLDGVALDSIELASIHVLPDTDQLIQGTPDADVLIGTDGNDRIEGSTDPFGRFEDGYDIITGGKGDDVLIGGPANSSVGGCIADIYRFGDDSGNDVILGFTVSLSGYSGCDVVDRIEIPFGINGTNIQTAADVVDRITENGDGWAVIDLGNKNSITLHGYTSGKITSGQIDVL
jgi:Ca2+-binding RTX toxin-like protein